jgi:CRISPR/Cas system-associated exonuclease Cas4 (RecB family)
MHAARPFSIVESDSAAIRLARAADFLDRFPPHQLVTIVAATRGAADDLARRVAARRGATIGLSRFSLTQLAARVAATRLAGEGVVPSTALGIEAVASRAAFDAAEGNALDYFGSVARTPGFPRALARTLTDVRLAGIRAATLVSAGRAGHDLAELVKRAEEELTDASTADRAALLATAAAGVEGEAFLRSPLLLIDLPVETAMEETFVSALTSVATEVLATVPAHDVSARLALERCGGVVEAVAGPRRTDLDHLRACLFSNEAPEPRELDRSLEFFSAPGEGRECVEIARRILRESKSGVPFDEMAVFVRSPEHYQGLLEHAFERAHIRAWFDRGTRRPHPAGRAFLALLACAAEGLSASRFAEYLSLGQLPEPDQPQAPWIASDDEVFGAAVSAAHVGTPEGAPYDLRDDPTVEADLQVGLSAEAVEDDDGSAVLAGSLRTPRRWERMLVEAAVVGGGPGRWERRLNGFDQELRARQREIERDDPASPRLAAIDDDRRRLVHLGAFALPIVSEMAAWPSLALWGEWLDRLDDLAPRTLRTPAYVRRVLADLRPMASVGPVSVDEVRMVLMERLRSVDSEPPSRRYGRVFVGSPAQARGRSFRVVFVPGLAERMFPRKSDQDPLLLDEARESLAPLKGVPYEGVPYGSLVTRPERSRRERLLLHLAAGAATVRLYVSYPRLDVAEGRARVPSFYALDVLRGATGTIPDLQRLTRAAAEAGDPTLAWPAPAQPDEAIDDQEHDLSVLRMLLDADDPSAVRGHAQYLLRLNESLRRSVTERWGRGQTRWSHLDGLTRVTDRTRTALESQRLHRRPYSISALQKFAACPYQFFLSAVYRLEPAERPEPLQRLDPLTRGSIVHRIQAVTYRELERRHALPVTAATVDSALAVLEQAIVDVADQYKERLAPAIDRVWHEEIAVIARDLRGWLRRTTEDEGDWIPRYFELSFGLPLAEERDPRSQREEVLIDGRFRLRGAVDLVEEHHQTGVLRVTDHKTGKDRTKDTLVIGGGGTLQPVLYSAAIEKVTGRPVAETRLFFCTAAGGYKVRPVPLLPAARRAGVEALEIVDRAIELGFLAAAPNERACAWCDFRPVCGPHEELRIARKSPDPLRDLIELRARP